MPPCVGSGWTHTRVARGSCSSGTASSATRWSPSAVSRVSGVRRAGSTLLARIGWLVTPSIVPPVRRPRVSRGTLVRSGVRRTVRRASSQRHPRTNLWTKRCPRLRGRRASSPPPPPVVGLPAGRVPVPPFVQSGAGEGARVDRPRHHVRRGGRDQVVATRAAVGLAARRTGDPSYDPGAVRPLLHSFVSAHGRPSGRTGATGASRLATAGHVVILQAGACPTAPVGRLPWSRAPLRLPLPHLRSDIRACPPDE